MVGSWWSFLWPCDTGWTAQVETLLMSLDPTSSSCCWWRGQPKTEAVFKIPAKPITINDHLFLDVWTTGHCLHSWSNLVQLSLQLLVGAWSPAQSCSSGCWNWTRPTLIWRKRVSDSIFQKLFVPLVTIKIKEGWVDHCWIYQQKKGLEECLVRITSYFHLFPSLSSYGTTGTSLLIMGTSEDAEYCDGYDGHNHDYDDDDAVDDDEWWLLLWWWWGGEGKHLLLFQASQAGVEMGLAVAIVVQEKPLNTYICDPIKYSHLELTFFNTKCLNRCLTLTTPVGADIPEWEVEQPGVFSACRAWQAALTARWSAWYLGDVNLIRISRTKNLCWWHQYNRQSNKIWLSGE